MKDLFGDSIPKPRKGVCVVCVGEALFNEIQAHAVAAADRSGGFQSHIIETSKRLLDSDMLEIDDEFIGKTFRYAWRYGEGGWQNICRRILACSRKKAT